MAITTVAKDAAEDLLRIADRLEPELRDAFLTALGALALQVPLNAITEMLEAGNTAAVQAIIADLKLPVKTLAESQRILLEALTRAANATGSGFGLSFSLTNPEAVLWAETYTGQLITGVTQETRQAVTEIVRRGLVEGVDVRSQARSIQRVVGLTERDAGVVDRLFVSLLDDGTPVKRASELANRKAARLLRVRAETIARTETMTAVHRGQLVAWWDAAHQGLIDPQTTRRVWIATEDDRLCPTCAVLNGQTVGFWESFVSREEATGFDIRPAGVLEGTPQFDIRVTGTRPLKEPIVSMTPPAHPRCRCDVGLVF